MIVCMNSIKSLVCETISSIYQFFKLNRKLLIFILIIKFCFLLFLINDFSQHYSYAKQYIQSIHLSFSAPQVGIDTSRYLVNSPNCQIIKWPTIDKEVLPLFKNRSNDRIKCKTTDILVERYNYTGIQVKIKSKETYQCFWKQIIRVKGTDREIMYSTYVEFDIKTVHYFPSNVSYIVVKCRNKKGNVVLLKSIALIPQFKSDFVNTDNSSPNILLIGLDSISRLQFERHFLKTKEILNKHKFYTMFGYNKVGDNTFPNLTPFLMGKYLKDVWDENKREDTYFDEFPFIWKEYKKKGYKTLLVEDRPPIATFNYIKPGFRHPPTDYYLRPYSLSIEDDVKHNCYLNKPEIETYYEYVYDFVKAMKERNDKYFAFVFMARLTHDYLNEAGLADPMVAQLFNRLFDDNLVANTVLIFFSDHGLRFGKIRFTTSGKFEERMPMMQMYLPVQWRNSHLDINQHRLTTHFDTHSTLKHIIDGKPDYSLKYGMSLLEEIPANRSCKSIPIEDHWCSCLFGEPIENLTLVQPMSEFIVTKVNQLLAKNHSKDCAQLTLKRIVRAFDYKTNNDSMKKQLMVTINAKPSDAYFEATVNIDKNTDEMYLNADISRIDSYGNDSFCIQDIFLEKYCYCKQYLEEED